MIVTEKKPLKEILKSLNKAKARKIAVIGCGSCATLAKTGGVEQVAEMSNKLSESGYEPGFQTVIETACHERLALKELKKLKDEVDAYLVLACGSGVQNIADIVDKPVIPALNTVFIGKTKKPGLFYEYCSACGECILAETGGICVKTRCPKGMLNGPCGGMNKGMCEVYPDMECAWVTVWKRTEGRGLDNTRHSNHSFKNLKPKKQEV